jgi:pimeloyl-ACP methyl ester carboxylesterase
MGAKPLAGPGRSPALRRIERWSGIVDVRQSQGDVVDALATGHSGDFVETHGQGPVILLTHGFGATRRMWDEQVEEFTGRHRMILWDLPGHGQRAAPADNATQDDLVGEMQRILDDASADRAVLCGLGLGGVLSLRFWRTWPHRVRGLVLIGTMPGLSSGIAREIWNARAADIAAAVEHDGLDGLEGGAEVDPRQHASASNLALAARCLLPMRDEGAKSFLEEIDVPTLILVGGDDRPNLTAAEFMASAIPDARKVVIPRANHAANLHKPKAVNTALRDFLHRLPR